MIIKFAKIATLALLATSLTFTSCKKKDEAQPDATQEQQATESASFSERTFENTMDIGEQSMDQTGMQARPAGDNGIQLETDPFPSGGTCATITSVLTPAGSTPNTATGRQVTIDFTPTGCLGADGRQRKGKIFITFERPSSVTGNQNPFNIIGRTVVITFGTGADAHFVDGVKVEGVHKTTVLDQTIFPTSAAQVLAGLGLVRNHRIEVGGAINAGVISGSARLTFPDGTTNEWSANRIRRVSATVTNTGIGGNFSPAIDRSSINVRLSGTQSGKTRQNNTYTAVTQDIDAERLWFKMCTMGGINFPRLTPVQGKITITGTNRPSVVLDYGSGGCDNQYTATVSGQTFNLTF
ncbi:MAG: hypothetical protein EAZ85_07090 [Bacteroidetes bacterium]|nr:MAG: hypothetical protein EAZ85_07090 [Bacteroidota bacterium]TAG86667.1 MAG: hypothetical protein EAZ20_12295 [Bacteroidota bacterium]